MLKKTSRMLLRTLSLFFSSLDVKKDIEDVTEDPFIDLIISVRYESCETQPCSPVSDYRLEQCRAFNGNNFKIEDLPKASSSSFPFSSS